MQRHVGEVPAEGEPETKAVFVPVPPEETPSLQRVAEQQRRRDQAAHVKKQRHAVVASHATKEDTPKVSKAEVGLVPVSRRDALLFLGERSRPKAVLLLYCCCTVAVYNL